MKKFLSLVITFILFSSLQLHAIIFESDTLSSVLAHADKDTLVVFDIDNTIMETQQYLGSDVWLCHTIDQCKSKGFSAKDVLNYILPLYFLIHEYHDMKPIQNAPALIKTLQNKNITVIALTNRSKHITQITLDQFDKMGIDFSLTSICDKNLEIRHKYLGFFKKGVIFCAANPKGEMLFLVLEKVGCAPKKILFIDDKLKYVKSVEKESEKHNIECIGIRFSGADATKAKFDPKEAEKQLHEFKKSIGLEHL